MGGIERSLQRLANGLVARKNDLVVFTGGNHKDYSVCDTLVEMEGEGTKYPVIYHKDTRVLVDDVARAVSEGTLDIISVADSWGLRDDYGLFDRFLRLNVPLVWAIGNQFALSEKFPFKDSHPDFLAKFIARIESFVCIGSGIAREAIAAGVDPKKVSIINNGVDQRIFHQIDDKTKMAVRQELGLPQHKKIFLYVGRVALGKGSDFLMESWKEVVEATPDAHLVIVGGLQPGDQLEQQFLKFKAESILNGQASFSAGFVQDETLVAKYHQACDVFILPSRVEGLPGVLVETMACGNPCIAAEHLLSTGVGDLLIPGVSGVTFAEYSPGSLISAINEVKPSMKENTISRFNLLGLDVDSTVRQYENLYRELVHGKPHSVAMVG